MVVQYPDDVKITNQSESSQNGSGDFTTAASETNIEVSGRAEPAGSGKFISGDNGEQILYDWIIYTPVISNSIKIGSQIEVKRDNVVRLKSSIKRITNGQLNTRIWV